MGLEKVTGVTSAPQATPLPPPDPPERESKDNIEVRARALFGRDTLTLSSGKKPDLPIRLRGFGDPDDDKFEDISINYQQARVERKGDKDTMGGIQISRGTDVWLPNEMLRMSLEAGGHLMGSGSSLAVGGGLGLKASLGSTMNVFGFGLPFGIYLKGGPGLNVTNVNGHTSMGIGADMAAGINLLGLNVEMFKTMATNVDETGFRIGINVKF